MAKVRNNPRTAKRFGNYLLRLQVLKLAYNVRDAGAIPMGGEVVVTDNQGVGVALMEVLQQLA